ncbi:hypothetical protein PCANC_24445 [Puccinia coronata f. sp. avenae]|uniref:Uncharacterized protein n=1 Tax=Puccinia coronata f. sp. avenae TaxID=200324 RepID=A0A2N5S8T8_9BASI|nr:hypothetical protein PCANC_24445 [Puccinia coronata f. sp. avenae]
MGGLDRTPPRGSGASASLVPAPPRNGVYYGPKELERMTAEQRAYVTAHPNFWIQQEPKGESSNGNNTFEAASVLNPGADGAGGKKPDNKSAGGGKYSQEANATADKIKKLRMGQDNMEVDDTGDAVKQEPADDQNAERQRRPSCVPHLETDIGKVFWKAYANYEDSCALETDPLSWEEFVAWIEDLNPITLSKQVVSDSYDVRLQVGRARAQIRCPDPARVERWAGPGGVKLSQSSAQPTARKAIFGLGSGRPTGS